jgi:hypothetical protein
MKSINFDMRKGYILLLGIAIVFCSRGAVSQIPAPQINLTGNLGCQGFPCFNNGTLIFASDANHTMTAQESSAQSPSVITVTSSVSLTGTRNLITPAGRFSFTIENKTTGGQSIQIIGPSGSGITIANGTTVSVGNDGTNYVQVGSGSYTLPIAQPSTLGGVKPDNSTCTVNASTGVLACPGSGGSSPFPASFDLHLLGASLEQSVDVQGEVVPSATNGGSGYTPNATCTVSISGLTGTAQPTMGAYTDAAGKVQWTLTYFGQGLSGTGTATVSGCGAGSGASATLTVPASSCTIIGGTSLCYNNPWPKQLTTLSAMTGRVSSFVNNAEGGSNVTDMWSAATTNNYATMCAGSGNHYVILGGSGLFNSMSSYGSHPNLTAPQAVTQYLSLSHYLKAAGCKTIIMTPNVGSTYAGGTGSSMSGTFINKVQQAAQILRQNTIQGIDYDLLIDTTSAIQTNTDPGFFSYDNTHWTLGGDNTFAAYANNQLLAGGGPGSNLAPYYNWPISTDSNGNWILNLASCSTGTCLTIAAGDGVPIAVYSTQANQLSGIFFQDGSTKTNQGHIGYANGSYGLGTNLIDIGAETGATATGVVIHGQGYASYLEVTNQIVGLTSLFEVTSPNIQFPTQAAGSGHNCLQIDTSGYVTNTGTACGSGSSGLSGMTAGQVPIAASASTVTSSEPLAGTGAGIVTGPTSGTTANDAAVMNGTNGQIKDAGFPPAPALAACTDETGSFTPANGLCYFATGSATSTTPAASAFVLFTVTTSSGGTWTASGTTIADGGNCSTYISGTTLTLTASETVTLKSDGTNIRASCTAASGGGGTVTSVATTSPITGGTITSTGTIACASCVTSSSPGVGIAHFAGSTQAVTSGLIVAADITSATITGTQIASSVAFAGSPTTTTQSAGDNSTKIATTAYANAAAYPVADTTITVGGSVAFSSGACSSVTGSSGTPSTVSMTGLLTTMTATFTPNSDVTDVTGWAPATTGQLYFQAWPSASGTLSYYVCNDTGSTVTTGASTTWNVSAR